MNREEDLDTQAIQAEKSWIEYCGYTLKNGDLESIFKKGAEWADAHPKNPWISVKDRLPCERSHVFTAGGTRVYNILLYHAGKFYQSLSQGLYDGGVTHWMSIPELNVEPKE